MDFTELRAHALAHGENEEAVTVNTRALIDKVLARYSGEWTTLRELIQNAADAQANTVKIKFETLPSTYVPLPTDGSQSELLKHTLLHATLRRLLVSNDGLIFGDNDWSRLKRIAEGNPNEDKIGAFGVGFYSVFADCEDPFVSSGKKAMAFYWKKDSLFTRQIQVENGTNDTNFVLDYRNSTTPVPSLVSLCQFLATSLTFVALQNIELWVDDWKIKSLTKVTSPTNPISIPRNIETTTKERMMKVAALSRESVQMSATFMNVVGWRPSSSSITKTSAFSEPVYGRAGSEVSSLKSFFSRLTESPSERAARSKTASEEKEVQQIVLEDLTKVTTVNVFLSVTTASIQTFVKSDFAHELERATKKPPPKKAKLAILTSSYDELALSTQDQSGAKISRSVDVFSSVLPGRKNGGRIFIGFPTNQTTGAGVHLSAPSLIPTVEREAIDLNARWVRTWNLEMLRCAGIMSRITFGTEMASLEDKLARWSKAQGHTRIEKVDVEKFIPEALHVLDSFAFQKSTPSAQISDIIDEAYWKACKDASIEIYSSRGVSTTNVVRLATEDLSGFVEGIPVLPEQLRASRLVQKFVEFGLLTTITIGDVKKELGAKALSKAQLIAFIGWAAKKAANREVDIPSMNQLLDVVVATTGDDSGGIITLSSVKYFIQPSRVPPEMPIPADTIPFEYTKANTYEQLQALGWEALDIATWLRFLVSSTNSRNGLAVEQDLSSAPVFAAQVLAVISKQWDTLHASTKTKIAELLSSITVIPTKMGMKRPKEAYFQSVKLFDDLPIITGCPGVKEKFLGNLGVRKTVELETIFQRLLSPPDAELGAEPKWNHVDLIVYLAGVKDDIPKEDLKKLYETPICAAEAGPPGHENTVASAKRYRISELYEPNNELRHLGLPILHWAQKGGYKPHNNEGVFLRALGLKVHPSAKEMVELMASSDLVIRLRAMRYFITKYEAHGYDSLDLAGTKLAFVPTKGDTTRLVAPSQCFVNEKANLLGFPILLSELVPHAAKFGVATDPTIAEAVQRLVASPPKDKISAKALFGYFSTRIGEREFASQTKILSSSMIVPVQKARGQFGVVLNEDKDADGVKMLTPAQCFIGKSDLYRDIFDFVDFGEEANRFLLACGSSHEPSRYQIAGMLAGEPARVLSIVQSPEKYLALLRLLAMSVSDLQRDRVLWSRMMKSPFLLSTKEISNDASTNVMDIDDDEEDAGVIKSYVLQPASRVVIVDDYNTYQLFKNDLHAAPQEEILEAFYRSLGALPLSHLEEQKITLGNSLPFEAESAKIRKKILERAKVFLYSYEADNLRRNKGWLEKNLLVEYVSSITIRVTLRGYAKAHSRKQTAILQKDSVRGKYVLLVTREVDYYDISLALVRHLLKRPNSEAATLFESILTSDLHGLKRRGFNVDRILRAQAAEARIAEDERQKQLKLEQEEINRKAKEFKEQQRFEKERPQSKELDMPGSFGAPPSPPQQRQPQPNRGLFSNLSRRLGLGGSTQEQLENFLGGGSNPPKENEIKPPAIEPAPPSPEPGVKPGEVERYSSPAEVQQSLLNAVQASQSHDASSFHDPARNEQVKEEETYCDSTAAHNMQHIGATKNGMRIYLSGDCIVKSDTFLSQNLRPLHFFAKLVYDVGDVYGITRSALSIFYDEQGGTMAFNRGNSLFFNFRFFLQNHWERTSVLEAENWWWAIFAHELAHNLEHPHNSRHAFWT